MKELIDKSSVVEEIEKRIKGLKDCHADTVAGYAGEISGLKNLLSFLDTLEVKEVDLEKEMDTYWNKYCNDEFGELVERSNESFDNIAKYFFELGIKAKGE